MGAERDVIEQEEAGRQIPYKEIALGVGAVVLGGVALYRFRNQLFDRGKPIEDPVLDILSQVAQATLHDPGRSPHFHYPYAVSLLRQSTDGDLEKLMENTNNFVGQVRENRLALQSDQNLQSKWGINGGLELITATARLKQFESYVKGTVRNLVARELYNDGVRVVPLTPGSPYVENVNDTMHSWWKFPTFRRLRHGLHKESDDLFANPEYKWYVVVDKNKDFMGYFTHTYAAGSVSNFGSMETQGDMTPCVEGESCTIRVVSVTKNRKNTTIIPQMASFLALREIGMREELPVIARAHSWDAVGKKKRGRFSSIRDAWEARNPYGGVEDSWRRSLGFVADNDEIGFCEDAASFEVQEKEAMAMMAAGLQVTEENGVYTAHISAGDVVLYDHEYSQQYPYPEDCRLLEAT